MGRVLLTVDAFAKSSQRIVRRYWRRNPVWTSLIATCFPVLGYYHLCGRTMPYIERFGLCLEHAC